MNVLLINPHKLIPVSFSLTQISTPPLGLAYIAGSLEQIGCNVTVFDCIAECPNNFFAFEQDNDLMVQGITFNDFFKKFSNHQFEMIGLTVMFSNNWLINKSFINEIKKKFPSSLVVAGGEHVSAIPEYCLSDCEGLDVVVIGEGEQIIQQLVRAIEMKSDFSTVNGIAYKSEGKIIRNTRNSRIGQINEITMPSWHLFPLDKYFSENLSYGVVQGNRSLPILATRGCPFTCTFCSSPLMWGTKYTMRDVDDVIREIKFLKEKYQISNFEFYDLTAIIKKDWILDFAKKIQEEKLNVTFQIPAGTRAEAVDHEVAAELFKAGCKNITYAPESGSPRILKAIKKKVRINRMLNSIRESHKEGMNIKLNMMIGFPGETFTDVIKTYIFLIKASYYSADDAAPAIFNPYPGSELFDMLVKMNKIVLNDNFFKNIAYSESFLKFKNYSDFPKIVLVLLLTFAFIIFYGFNFLFRPIRLYRLFKSFITKKYESRGAYYIAHLIKRKKNMKTTQLSSILPSS
jgi:radical SAM superfamily enzyme YgiQ (UPF0313 family)